MLYRNFLGNNVSLLGFGAMRFPVQADKAGSPIDRPKSQVIIDRAIELGINYFDTAYVYHGGESEPFLGEALEKYPRQSYYLATKFFIGANPDYKAVFEEQLSRLRTDYIDYYLIHNVNDGSIQSYLDSGCVDYFLEQKKAGRIRHLGFSNHGSMETLKTFLDRCPMDFCQIQLNYFDWYLNQAKAEYDLLAERNIPVIIMEPVRGGKLANLTPDAEKILKALHPDWSSVAWAMRFLMDLDATRTVLSGMSTLEQLEENAALFSQSAPVGGAEQKALKEAATLFLDQLKVPCTDCRYCCDDCPENINIPAYLAVLNTLKVDGNYLIHEKADKVESKGKLSDCTECGSCAEHCPQDLKVPELLKELAEAVEKSREE